MFGRLISIILMITLLQVGCAGIAPNFQEEPHYDIFYDGPSYQDLGLWKKGCLIASVFALVAALAIIVVLSGMPST